MGMESRPYPATMRRERGVAWLETGRCSAATAHLRGEKSDLYRLDHVFVSVSKMMTSARKPQVLNCGLTPISPPYTTISFITVSYTAACP